MENIEARPEAERTLFTLRLEIEAPKNADLLDLTRVLDAISGVIPPKWKITIKSPRRV